MLWMHPRAVRSWRHYRWRLCDGKFGGTGCAGKNEGYSEVNAEAKVCQDIVLKAISQSSLSRNVTVKGGVVMRSITGNVRRATQDMDLDFLRYSLSETAIRAFVEKLNCLEGITITITGDIEELSQQEYRENGYM